LCAPSVGLDGCRDVLQLFCGRCPLPKPAQKCGWTKKTFSGQTWAVPRGGIHGSGTVHRLRVIPGKVQVQRRGDETGNTRMFYTPDALSLESAACNTSSYLSITVLMSLLGPMRGNPAARAGGGEGCEVTAQEKQCIRSWIGKQGLHKRESQPQGTGMRHTMDSCRGPVRTTTGGKWGHQAYQLWMCAGQTWRRMCGCRVTAEGD
jgi:hypothetical protein